MNEPGIAYDFLKKVILSEPLYKAVKFDAKWYSSFAGFSRMIYHDYCDYCSENSVFEWNCDPYIHDTLCKLAEYNKDSQSPIFRSICFSRTLRLHKNTYFTAYSNAESDLDVLAVM